MGVIGATGYSGVELVHLICEHPRLKLTYVAGASSAGLQLGAIYPYVPPESDVTVVAADPSAAAEVAAVADVVFLALSTGESARYVGALRQAGCLVIDLGGDLRLENAEEEERWYGAAARKAGLEMDAAGYLGLRAGAVYGLSELHRPELVGVGESWRASLGRQTLGPLVTNPGCYPTASVLALAPLLAAGWLEPTSVIVDAKSGVTGAGRTPKRETHLVEAGESFGPYRVGSHQHQPEIAQEMSRIASEAVRPRFTAQLLPTRRGILVSVYAVLRQPRSKEELRRRFSSSYGDAPWVRLLPDGIWPQLHDVVGSNFALLALDLDEDGRRVSVFAAIDNLLKGAAGQAVQNLNLLAGWEETLGLPRWAWRP